MTRKRSYAKDYGAIIEQASINKKRTKVVDHEGRKIAAVIPIEDLEFLEELEDQIDLLEALEAVDEAVRKGGVIPWDEFVSQLKVSELPNIELPR